MSDTEYNKIIDDWKKFKEDTSIEGLWFPTYKDAKKVRDYLYPEKAIVEEIIETHSTKLCKEMGESLFLGSVPQTSHPTMGLFPEIIRYNKQNEKWHKDQIKKAKYKEKIRLKRMKYLYVG